MAQESRQESDPRISVRLRARISTIEPETDPRTGKRFFRAADEICANVSRGGAFVSMRETIPTGRRVLVELDIPGDQEIQAVGRVAWTRTALATGSPAGNMREPGIGIQFLAGNGDGLRRLDQFVTRAIRRRSPPHVVAGLASPEQT